MNATLDLAVLRAAINEQAVNIFGDGRSTQYGVHIACPDCGTVTGWVEQVDRTFTMRPCGHQMEAGDERTSMTQAEQEMFAFWRERLDEDEQLALEAAHGYPGEWTTTGSKPVSVADELPPEADVFERVVAFDEGAPSEEQAAHIAWHDPARVLRDVAAARARLAQLEEAIGARHDAYDLAAALLPLELVAYDKHPGYKEGWRP